MQAAADFKPPCTRCVWHREQFLEFRWAAKNNLSGLQRLYKNHRRRKAAAKARAAAMKRRLARQAKKIDDLTVLAGEQHGRLVAHAMAAKRPAAVSATPVSPAKEKAAARAETAALAALWSENVGLRAEIDQLSARLRASGLRAPQACPAKQQGAASAPPHTHPV